MSSSATSSDLSSGTPSPPPELSMKAPKSSKRKSITSDNIRNEGTGPDWVFRPPHGFSLVDRLEVSDEWDWDSLNDDKNAEIWLIRVPETIKPKYLESLKLDGLSTDANKTTHIGSMTRRHASYDILSVGKTTVAPPAGEELQGLTCLLPRKAKKGELYPAPRPITRHILVHPKPVHPSHEEPGLDHFQSEPRHSYPKEMLKGRFLPVGSEGLLSQASQDSDKMDVDSQPKIQTQSSPSQEKRIKKRKATEDNESASSPTKKAKKIKTQVDEP
ncbi:hypothetical protein DL96DRAFT_1712663 [Flagelloscypha sp. PMI_526]|nr:hypothetical protein DL96DRAFT_1712663 [Flagelloscypha sp. PMI_526]